jgi:hypothetical protein
VVQDRSDIVDAIPNDQSDSRIERPLLAHFENKLPIRLRFSGFGVISLHTVKNLPKGYIKVGEVIYCPA